MDAPGGRLRVGVTEAARSALRCRMAPLALATERSTSSRHRQRALAKAKASRPADPPPSSHWARFEQESRQPLSLANGRRRPRRPRFLASVAGSCHKGGDVPRAPARMDETPTGYLVRLAVSSAICGEAFIPTLPSRPPSLPAQTVIDVPPGRLQGLACF